MVNLDDGKKRLVENLVRQGIFRSARVRHALLKVPREEFVSKVYKNDAYLDTPLPLEDSGQTISAPHMVAIMLEELDLIRGLNVLEIGAGSGYNAALICELVGPEGSVTSVERVPELVEFASNNLKRAGYSKDVEVVLGDGTLGYPQWSKEEIYDRIIVTAASPRMPKILESQLKRNGILLIPIGGVFSQELIKLRKHPDGRITRMNVCGCVFVPLIGADGYSPI